jgi:hypothetical protein
MAAFSDHHQGATIEHKQYTNDCEPGRSVGIATGYGLGGPGIEFSLLFTFERVGRADSLLSA